jgi:hypothetical protein
MASQSPFFRLPRELRDKVYHHLLSGLAYDIRKGSNHFTVEYGHIIPDRSFVRMSSSMSLDYVVYIPFAGLSWLLACSTILSEGLAQFERASKCTGVRHFKDYKGEPEWKTKLVGDTLLLPLVREMYLAVATVPQSAPNSQKPMIACRFQTQNPKLAEGASRELGYRNVIPQARKISVEVQTRILTVADGKEFCLPAYEERFKSFYYFPGSTYEEVHLRIALPEVPRSALPAIARTMPKLQASLIELGKSLTATSTADINATTNGQHWAVRDWIDAGTHTWHMTVKRRCLSLSSLDTLQQTGLQYFRYPELKRTPAILGRYAKELIFARDVVPKAGTCSWSCSDTGETVFIYDDPNNSQSGYMSPDTERTSLRFEAVFEELRRQQQETPPVTEGMGKVEPTPPRSSFVRNCSGLMMCQFPSRR